MKPDVPDILEKGRVRTADYFPGEWFGAFVVRHPETKCFLRIIAGKGDPKEWPFVGEPWDHVSVSLQFRTPTWEEMAWVKDLCFDPEETVIQLHPPKSLYVNTCGYCLHLWKPVNSTIPLPPIGAV